MIHILLTCPSPQLLLFKVYCTQSDDAYWNLEFEFYLSETFHTGHKDFEVRQQFAEDVIHCQSLATENEVDRLFDSLKKSIVALDIRDGASLDWEAGDDASLDWEAGGGASQDWEADDGASLNWEAGDDASLDWEAGGGASLDCEADDGASLDWEAGDDASLDWEAGDDASLDWEAGDDARTWRGVHGIRGYMGCVSESEVTKNIFTY